MTSYPDPATALLGEALAALLEGDEPPWDDEPEPAPDADRADAMLRRLARLEREQEEVLEQLGRLVATATEWADRETERRQQQITWLKASLGGYLRGVYDRTGTMSLHLPAGDLTSRKGREEWIVVDEPALLAWAAEHAPTIVRQPPAPAAEVDRAELKRLLTQRDERGRPIAYGITADGEVPPGLKVEHGDRTYDARPNHEEQQ